VKKPVKKAVKKAVKKVGGAKSTVRAPMHSRLENKHLVTSHLKTETLKHLREKAIEEERSLSTIIRKMLEAATGTGSA
jgi:hypothetical protein